ncbi:hypothetical protein Hanom_Chr01g00033331 [Helianthus anomalus]
MAKFFYVKATAITARLRSRNTTDTIATEKLNTPEQGKQTWLPHLHLIPSRKSANRELQILRMVLQGKPGQNMKPVLRKKNESPDKEGWYDTIVGNFWVPGEVALNALLPQGKGKVFLVCPHYFSFGNVSL